MDDKTRASFLRYFKSAPADSYFRFLTDEKHQLTNPKRANGREDPFALALLNRQLAEYYFPRGNLETQIRRWGSQVIIGRRASGKTTMLRKTADPVSGPEMNRPDALAAGEAVQIDRNDLAVVIPLQDTGDVIADKKFLDGFLSPLSVSVLPRYIMSDFFAKFICSPAEQAGLLADYRKNLSWMEALCWFYNNFTPLRPTFESDFELMAWLSQYETLRSRVTWPRTDIEKLERLIRFVTSPVESITGKEQRRYRRVVILVDGTEEINHPAVERLLADFARLAGCGLDDRLCVKLFIDRRHAAKVEALEPVRLGQVMVTEMPEWSGQDLKNLLLTRPLICTGQLPAQALEEIGRDGIVDNLRNNWTWKLVPHVFPKEVRGPFLNQLIDSARLAYQYDDVYDAPYHALRLTRGILWHASTIAEAASGPKELNMNIIQEICALYWSVR